MAGDDVLVEAAEALVVVVIEVAVVVFTVVEASTIMIKVWQKVVNITLEVSQVSGGSKSCSTGKFSRYD